MTPPAALQRHYHFDPDSAGFGGIGHRVHIGQQPQAKGRVERCFGTVQDRLVKKLRLNWLNSITQANEFLKKKCIPCGI